MKNSILLLIFITSFNLIAQTNTFSNFIYDEGSVVWQKVYETELSTSDLIKYFQDSGVFLTNTIRTSENSVRGEIATILPNYEGSNVKRNTVPIMFKEGYKGFCIIEIKDNRYRVTLSRAKFVSNLSISIGSVTSENNDTEFEFLFNDKKGQWKSFFLKNGRIVNYSLEKAFSVKKPKQNQDNW